MDETYGLILDEIKQRYNKRFGDTRTTLVYFEEHACNYFSCPTRVPYHKFIFWFKDDELIVYSTWTETHLGQPHFGGPALQEVIESYVLADPRLFSKVVKFLVDNTP